MSAGLRLSHFQALLLFALAVSVALGFLSRRAPADRFKYAVRSLLWFVLVAVAIGWVMYPFSR